MSHYPPYGPPPPPHFPGGPPHPPHHFPGGPPPPPHHYPGGGHHHGPHHPPYAPYYVPGIMVPVPTVPAVPPPAYTPEPQQPPQPTYITNYIYHGDTQAGQQPVVAEPQPLPIQGVFDVDWVPATNTTAAHLAGSAVVAGHEGWDGSPLWVIRARHNGDLVPGKLSVKHSAAFIPHGGREVAVQDIEVMVARADQVRWLPASNGNIPVGAIPAGNTANGEPLYVGRARYQLSLTPGKVHPSHSCCYISFGGNEVAHKQYDVLCRNM